jgi:hypothetical protein
MSDMNRRTLVTTGASLLATGASLILLREVDAALKDGASHPSANGTAMDGHHHNEDMQRCIQLCHDCHAHCISMINHCLTLGGQYAAPAHIRVLMDCAQMCTITADFMARASSFHDRTCRLCAELCRSCADSCVRVAGDDQSVKQCAELCRRCAESCDQMALNKAA